MASKVLFANRQTSIRVCTLNSPKTLNALDLDMVRLLSHQLSKYAENETVGAIFLEGALGSKTKAFCAGGDIMNLHQNASKPETRGKCHDFFLEEYTLNYMLKHYNKPLISVLDGITMGGGVGVSVHGQFRIATENTVFAMPECGIGFFPDVGCTHLLPSLPLGTYLGFTGERLKGREVVDAGIATHFVSSDRIESLKHEVSEAVSHHVAGNPGVVDVRQVVQNAIESVALATDEVSTLQKNAAAIAEAFDVDLSNTNAIETIVENLKTMERESGEGVDTKWCTSALKNMSNSSPFALQATRELFHHSDQGASDFGVQLSKELKATETFMAHADFLEGVSAAIIDRRKPSFASLATKDFTPVLGNGGVDQVDWNKRVSELGQ